MGNLHAVQRAGIIGICTFLGTTAPVGFGAESATQKDAAQPAPALAKMPALNPNDLWKNDVGEGFRKGTQRINASVTAGWGGRILGTSEIHDVAGATLSWSYLTKVYSEDKFYRGNGELRLEAIGLGQYQHTEAYVAGFGPIFRYNFATGTRWIPFYSCGAELLATDIGKPDLGGNFQFGTHTGAGLQYFFGERTAASAEYRFMHISNAHLTDPNRGVNLHMVMLGVSWFY